ncbi:MAG: DsbA family protein [Paracoccaceae bacterium]
MRRSLLAAALIALAAFGGFLWSGRPDSRVTDLVPPFVGAAEAQTTDTAAAPATEVPDMVLGNAEAAVTVIEYASFTCPHCRNWHSTVWPEFRKNYVDTGKVKFVYREVYFDKFGLWAAMVARCGGPMKYFGIADMVYDTQKDWIADGQDATIAGNLRKIGLKAGIAQDQLDACLKDNAMAKAMVASYQKNATADGVEGTPTFIINGEKVSGEMTYADFARIIDGKLGG